MGRERMDAVLIRCAICKGLLLPWYDGDRICLVCGEVAWTEMERLPLIHKGRGERLH
jgi:hypothetical protein